MCLAYNFELCVCKLLCWQKKMVSVWEPSISVMCYETNILPAYCLLCSIFQINSLPKRTTRVAKGITFLYIPYTIKIIIWGTKLQWVWTFFDGWHFTKDRAPSDYLECDLIQVQWVSNTNICLHSMCKRNSFFLHGDKHFDTVYVYTLYRLTE